MESNSNNQQQRVQSLSSAKYQQQQLDDYSSLKAGDFNIIDYPQISSEEDDKDDSKTNDSQSGEKVYHFYWITNKTEATTNFSIKFKNIYVKGPINMVRRDENIFYAQVTIKNQDLEEVNEMRYSYVKMGVQDTLEQSEESEQERTKSKKFLRLCTFFDNYQAKKFMVTNKNEVHEQFIRFLIRNSNKEDMHFGKPYIFAEYMEYFKEEGASFPYNTLFKMLATEYQTRSIENAFNLYIIELLSLIDTKIIKKKNKYLGPLATEMQKQNFGYFKKLLPLDNQRVPNYENLIRGIQNLYTVNPLIGLEFFNDIQVVPQKIEFLKSINLKDDYNYIYLKHAIKQCHSDLSFTKHSLRFLIEYVLQESKDLDVFLSTVEDLMQYSESESIAHSMKQLKNRFISRQIKDFVRVNLERIITIYSLQKVLRKEIQDQIYSNLKNLPNHTANMQYLLTNPQLLDTYYLSQIVVIKNNMFLQNEFKRLVISLLTHTSNSIDFQSIKDVLIQNFNNLVSNQASFVKCHQILCNFIELANDSCFFKVNQFSQNNLLKQLKRSMATIQSQYPLQFLLSDLLTVLSNQQDQSKTFHLIEVALEIIQKLDINEIIIKLVIEKFFHNDKIVFEELRPITDFIISKISKIKQLYLPTIFDDELIYLSLRISIYYQNNDFLYQLNKKVVNFAQKISDKSIYLKDIKQIIVTKKKYLIPMLQLIEPNLDVQILDELIQINQTFKQKVDKHQIFLNWASRSNIAVDIKNYEKEITRIQGSFDNLTAAKANSEDLWIFFQRFQTIEKYYHFRYSKLFENLFLNMSQEVGKNLIYQEEHEVQGNNKKINHNNLNGESLVKQISMSQFDKLSQDILFGKICKDHFNCLMKYPLIPFKQDTLAKYWQNISPKFVITELSFVLEYELNQMNHIDAQMPMELSDHLQKYGNQYTYYQQSIILISLEAFAIKQKVFNLDEDLNFLKLKQYVEFISSSKSQDMDLIVIAQEVNRVQGIFTVLEKNEHVKWDILEELSKSKDTFEFSIANIGLDFNDLFERLDEDSFLTNSTISDMNSVSNYFNNLYLKLLEQQNLPGFLQLLEFFSNDLSNEIQNDPQFKAKLSNCNSNLSAIKQIADATKNVAENTLQIIADCLQYGSIVWTKDKDRFDYQLKVNFNNEQFQQQTNEIQFQHHQRLIEELKEDGRETLTNEELSTRVTQIRTVAYDQDKVNQHCSRAILLIHSKKTNPNQQQQIEEDVNLFAQIVAYAQEINQLLKDLSQYGKRKYKDDHLEFICVIERASIKDELVELQQSLKNDLQEWKEKLAHLRQKYYFLTYVPNSMIANLIDCFEQPPDSERLQDVVNEFKKYKMLQKDTPNDLLNDLKKGDNLYEKFQQIWARHMIDQEINLRQKMDKITTQFQLQSSKVEHRYVTDDLSLIKAIISLFTISGSLPQSTDILFCTDLTQINEVETFVMRAMLCHKQIGRKKLFIMANFQKLSFSIQNQCYDFIKQWEHKYSQNSTFYLYIISVCQDIKQAHLIEEERSSSSFFQQHIREDQMREVFRKFELIKVVKSEQCGLGKSEFIRTQINRYNNINIRIPIYGELNRKKLIELHQKKISELKFFEAQNIAIHYDIYPTSKEELNVIMFELLLLGSLSDYQNNTFYLPDNIRIYVEISQSLNDEFVYLFFNYLKNTDIKWGFTNIKVGHTKDDKVQKVCRYLHALDESQKYKPELLIEPATIFTDLECQIILKKHVLSRLKSPNYYYINSFINFVADQINRMEESVFFTPENLQRQMVGFFGTANRAKELHKEIVKQLVQLALKISIVEKYQDQSDLLMSGFSKRSTQEEQANRFRDLQWDVYNNPFIVFNDGGTITPIFRKIEDVPKAIVDYQERANKRQKDGASLKKYDELTNDEYIEKILEICVDEGQKEKLRKQKDLKNIVFTLDNFMKLVLIYLRIRAQQPIILMGETGVGKTSLVEYLAKIIDAEFRVLNVHAGITEQEIIKFVEEAQEIAQIQEDRPLHGKRKIILFFDEINTNYNISGLLKEIFIDRHLNGNPLEKNICLVSACNPYKLRKQEISGQTSGIRINEKDNTLSKLVYRVLPLPESMIPFIWDYKSLNEDEEKKYITKMVEKTYENAKILGRGISLINLWVYRLESERQKVQAFNQEIKNISMIVQKSQTYIKKEEDSPWAVSLRDVSRFCKFFVYFFMNNVSTDSQVSMLHYNDLRGFSSRDISLILSIYFCYVIRISVFKERSKFINYLSQITNETSMQNINTKNFIKIVINEQDRFLDQMELKPGIGKNAPLKENIFVMITCILNQIPLIITGKPGSSKTLAMNLINKSFKGTISSKEFFKRFPAFLTFYYQGSEQSTSKGIERIYKKAHKTQKKVREKNTQVVVIFDEIGLAEKSPHNPLKVLHSLLEPPKVATVGISNWSLDASKMNRVITLSRTDPNNQDLFESANSIAKDCNPIFGSIYLKSLVDWYIYYIQRQENTPKCRNFHGLRDFYSMIKFISQRIVEDEELNEMTIVHGIQRNFGGSNFDLVIQSLEMHVNLKNQDLLKKIKPDQLIKDNLVDFESRHLMIITDNFENTLQFIQDECQSRQRQYEIFYGSDFPDDQNEESIYKQINEIILQMENGTLCIFLNLNSIYQSFYDMLNQNYQEIGNQRFCKVAIGPDSSRCLVHNEFKCILVVDQSKIDELDPPLLNRFEKQLFTEEISIDQEQKMIINKLNNWINNMQVKNFTKRQMLPTLDDQQTLQQLVILNKEFYESDFQRVEKECKLSLIRVSTFQGIIRSQESVAADRMEWYEEYINSQQHYNLHQLLKQYLSKFSEVIQFQKTQGFNLIVYTFQAMINRIESDQKIRDIDLQEKLINLSGIHKKKQFQQKIEDFFSNSNPNRLLLIYADMLSDSKNRINLCRSIINNQRTKRLLNNKKDEELKDKHICFIIRIDQYKDDQSISFGKDWRQYTVDLLNGKGQTDISVKKLIKSDFETLIRLASSQTSLFETSIVESMSKIYYNKDQDFIKGRISYIQELFQNEENIEYLRQMIMLKVKRNDNFDSINQSWRLQVVKNEFLMKSNLTFHGAALEYIKTELVKYLAFIIFYLEQDGIINAYTSKDLFALAKEYFRNLFRNNYINNRIQDMYFLANNFDRIKFPLARLIHQQFMQLKIQYIKILKEQATQDPNDHDDDENTITIQISQQLEMLEEEKNASQGSERSGGSIKKSERFERAKFERLRKIMMRDRQLCENISNLGQWCKIYFPQDYIDQKILSIDNEIYADDFSYLLDNQDIITQNSFHSEYNQFIKISLSLIMKEKFESKSQIYGVYWKYENMLTTVWKIVKDNIKLFEFKKMIEKFETEVKSNEAYTRSELVYVPREAFLECLIKVFYQLYYPSEALRYRFNLWEQNVKQTFQKLNDLAFYYLQVQMTHESRVIMFLLKFNQDILAKSQPHDKEKIFIYLATKIKDIFKKPDEIITAIFDIQDQLLSNQNGPQKQALKKKIFKFVCEYIIDADQEGDEIDLEFLLDDIISKFIHSSSESLQHEELQYDEKFKFIMLKLIYISLYEFESETILGALTTDQEEYKQFLEENELVQTLDTFINKHKNLKFSSPFIIAITDQLEENIDDVDYEDEDEDDLAEKLKAVQQITLNEKASTLQKLVAVAYFKKLAFAYCEDLSSWMSGEDQFEAVELQNNIEKFFDVPLSIEKQKLLPFLVYIIKLLYQSHDVLKTEQEKMLQKNKWIQEYLALKPSFGSKSFSFINHEDFKAYRQEAYQKINNLDDLLKIKELQTFRKFTIMLTLVEQTYLQGKPLDQAFHQKLFGMSKEEDLQPNCVVSNAEIRDFLLPFCTNQFEEHQERNKFIKLEGNDKLHFFKILQMFLGCASLSGNSFLNEFFTNPQNIKEYYVPFVQNVKEDYEYQQKLKNNEHLISLQCSQCKQISLVVDLGRAKESSKSNQSQIIHQGDRNCQICKGPNNENEGQSKMVELNKGNKNVRFSTDDIACKSYIPFETESYMDIKIRFLNENEISIGRIILHSLLMLCLFFAPHDKETEIFTLILSDYPYSNLEYRAYLTRAIKYLVVCIQNDWKQLKINIGINDEKVLQIIQHVIIEMVKNNNKFKCDQLSQISGRILMEKSFSDICKPIFQDLNKFFNQAIGFDNSIEQLLLELNQIQSQDYYNLLRIKGKISIKQFETYLSLNERNDQKFFKLLFEQKESIQSIQYLKPLIQWAKYILNKWNAQLTYDEANELTIRDIIERENAQNKGNKDYILKIEKDFAKFQHAWNKFAGLIIRDKNVEVTIPIITQSSKLIYCCITSDKYDQPGHILYLLLKYLAHKQNKVLEEATKMVKQKQQNQINSVSFASTSILNLRKDQIIYFREKVVRKQKRKATQMNNDDPRQNEIQRLASSDSKKKEADKEKEKFEQSIIDNSSCNLKYSQGKIVEYNIEAIKSCSIELLLQGKHMIDLDQMFNFQFVNIGNLYSQFEDIEKKIKQDVTDQTNSVLEHKTMEETHALLGQLRVTMNFIQNSLIHKQDQHFKELPLLEFMRTLKILDNDPHLGSDIKLKHIICLYEAVEERVEHIEVEKINPRYQVPLHSEDKQFTTLGKLINEKKEHVELLMHIIGRLCIRQLRNFSKDLTDQKLFPFLASKPQLFRTHFESSKLNSQDSSEDLNGDGQVQIKADHKQDYIRQLIEEFYACPVDIKHAKDVYHMLRQQFQKIEQEKRAALEKEKKKQQMAQNGRQVGDLHYSDILISFENSNDESKQKKKKNQDESKVKKGKKKKGRIERVEENVF